jgi:hypothetical protein
MKPKIHHNFRKKGELETDVLPTRMLAPVCKTDSPAWEQRRLIYKMPRCAAEPEAVQCGQFICCADPSSLPVIYLAPSSHGLTTVPVSDWCVQTFLHARG